MIQENNKREEEAEKNLTMKNSKIELDLQT